MFCSLIPFEGDNPMTLGDVCNRSVVVAERNETIAEAANRMRALHVGDLVVVESRGDDVMSTDLVTAREHDSMDRALAKMGQHGIRRLPIVDADGNLIGIVAREQQREQRQRV
jgi:CBS domain-containing protein